MIMKLHKAIKKEIFDQGRTITWVGLKLGISQPLLSQKLSGRPKLKESEVLKIEELLGVKFERNEETK